jgi:hypothetical protein
LIGENRFSRWKNWIENYMKIKIVFHFVLFVLLATSMTGCLTRMTLDDFHSTDFDTLTASAVYQTTNRDSFALEGQVYSCSTRGDYHAFLIIPQDRLASANLQTNETLSLDEIKKLPLGMKPYLKPIDKLPSNYQKIADLPQNYERLNIKEKRLDAGVIILLPFAAIVDVVTFPLYLLMLSGMGHGC